MSKLDDVEARHKQLSDDWGEPTPWMLDHDWLIERARKLETALRRASDENLCLCPYASEDKHTADCLYAVAREALKED